MCFCVVLCVFVLFYVFLCSMYCCVSFSVCVYMCTVLLPPGGYPFAVKYIISCHITSNGSDVTSSEKWKVFGPAAEILTV